MSGATLYASILVAVGIAFCGGYMVCIGTGLAAEQLVSLPLVGCGIFVALAAGHLIGVLARRGERGVRPTEATG